MGLTAEDKILVNEAMHKMLDGLQMRAGVVTLEYRDGNEGPGRTVPHVP
jgi:hypothetical protein